MSTLACDFPADQLLSWYEEHGRHDLPWREPDRSAYDLLVAEILLQRTTASAVANLYVPFLARYPSPAAVVAAPSDELGAMTARLGLATRAEYIERTAGLLLADHDGAVPTDHADLLALHGVGEYTARSVLAHCYAEEVCAVDANVDRILTRYFGLDAEDAELEELADEQVPADRASGFLHALLDLGSAVCTARSPTCEECPLADGCARAGTA